MVGIYKITNRVNGKIYVGQSIRIERRIREHKTRLFSNDSFDYPLYRSMREYGVENFTFEVLEECLVSELDGKELYYINYYNSCVPLGYNQVLPNQRRTTLVPLSVDQIINLLQTTSLSDEEIGEQFQVSGRSIRAINYGESWHQDGIQYPIKNRQTPTTHSCLICGTQTTNKIFCSQICSHKNQQKIGRPSKEELLELIYKTNFALVGRQFGVNGNTIRKWCKSYGLPFHIEEIKQLYRKQNNITIPSKNTKTFPKKVAQVDKQTGEVINTFESAGAAAKSISKGSSHIVEVCNGKLKTAYGYKWEYI